MTWDKLADRCLLFTDANKGTLIELLKEAELDMSRKCNIFEFNTNYVVSSATGVTTLNAGFKSIIAAWYKGNLLHPILENELDLDQANSLPAGDPTGYFIRPYYSSSDPKTYLQLDHKTSGDIVIHISGYYTVEGKQNATGPIISEQYQTALCDYAIAVSAARTNPQLFDKHMALWNGSMGEITIQSSDMELVHRIKNEI